jgi:hypothetical protein
MASKETKTATELAALIMREIRELPECDHIARVAITRSPRQRDHQPNWRFSWTVNGSWAVPESAFKIAERLQAKADLASSDGSTPSDPLGVFAT